MPIIENEFPVSVIFGIKDLVLSSTIADYVHSDKGTQKKHQFKTIDVCVNRNGAVKEGVTQEELGEGKSDPVVRLSFSSDESIDNLINQLQKLRDATLLFERYTYSYVLEETVAFYSNDPNKLRCVSEDDACYYYDKESGNMCAVGRYLKEPERFEKDEVHEMDFFALLKEASEAKGVHDPYSLLFNESVAHLRDDDFWSMLQNLHDSSSYWNKHGLSEYGNRKYNELMVYAEDLDRQMRFKCSGCFGERHMLTVDHEKVPCKICGAM